MIFFKYEGRRNVARPFEGRSSLLGIKLYSYTRCNPCGLLTSVETRKSRRVSPDSTSSGVGIMGTLYVARSSQHWQSKPPWFSRAGIFPDFIGFSMHFVDFLGARYHTCYPGSLVGRNDLEWQAVMSTLARTTLSNVYGNGGRRNNFEIVPQVDYYRGICFIFALDCFLKSKNSAVSLTSGWDVVVLVLLLLLIEQYLSHICLHTSYSFGLSST
jgi:hypothetical protein